MNSHIIQRRGLMFVLSSPSGVGKTTIAKHLLQAEDNLVLSISMTTRPKRPGEIEGKDYHFVTDETFKSLSQQGVFLEEAHVFDRLYGTPRAPVEEALAKGQDVLFDIDWQGAQSLTQSARSDVVKVFLLPPSWAELHERLKRRNQDHPEVVERRMAQATYEMSHWPEYDYVIINHHIGESVAQVRSILTSERLNRDRQVGLLEFVKSLHPSGEKD